MGWELGWHRKVRWLLQEYDGRVCETLLTRRNQLLERLEVKARPTVLQLL